MQIYKFEILQLCNLTGLLDRPAGWTSWTDQLNGSAGEISWTDQLDRPAGRTSSLYLKPWPVRIFEDWPFSLSQLPSPTKALFLNGLSEININRINTLLLEKLWLLFSFQRQWGESISKEGISLSFQFYTSYSLYWIWIIYHFSFIHHIFSVSNLNHSNYLLTHFQLSLIIIIMIYQLI